jgi:hypothetical protein
MSTNYTFTVSLLEASENGSKLEVWQNGTLTLETSSSASLSGALTLPGYYNEPIPFNGSTEPPNTMAGTIVGASGKSSEAEITFTITYNYDGFLYDGSYLGGLVSMLDYDAQETYFYVIQGLSPQGPFGSTFRGYPDAKNKRRRT